MKSYPSIGKDIKAEADYYCFDKLDGSNMRFEWDRTKGWHLFGTRTKLLDVNDPILGPAKPLFLKEWADPLEKIAQEQKWQSVVFYAEFSGPQSFAGKHEIGDEFTLRLFDAAPYKRGILGPGEFLDLFGHLPIATYLGKHMLNDSFLQSVRDGSLPGITHEGIVAKRGTGHHLEMVKIKTQAWADKVRLLYSADEAARLIAS